MATYNTSERQSLTCGYQASKLGIVPLNVYVASESFICNEDTRSIASACVRLCIYNSTINFCQLEINNNQYLNHTLLFQI